MTETLTLDTLDLERLNGALRSAAPGREALLAAALEDPQRGALIVDRQMRAAYITDSARRLLGLPDDLQIANVAVSQLLGRGCLDELSANSACDAIARALEGKANQALLLRAPDAKSDIHMATRSIGPSHAVASFETAGFETAAGMPRFRSFDVADSLTGLASRTAFENALKAALRRSNQAGIGVMLLDLDRFKAVNDTLGHGAGDAVLRLAAERLTFAVRGCDMVARLGGDEFAILLDPASAETAASIAQRILEIVQRTYLIEGQLVNVGTSIGIALTPEHGAQAEALMRNADLALYDAKHCGRANFKFFDIRMDARAQARRMNELELRRALSLRQFEVHYQPQVDTQARRVVGFEALVRWNHPERGLIPPSDFLPLAEEIGVIAPMGDWVLRTACRQAMEWSDDVKIAVNASPSQFITGRFADTVRRVIAGTGLRGKRLEIEITEGLLLRNEPIVFQTLDALREMGIGIAMDDFGTGYASLSQLAHFPFDKIKIDRSLSGFEGHFPKHRAIVRAIAALGESLGVSTMAEGVETPEQLRRLQQDGCTSVQGYLFSKPVPASETARIIAELNS